MAGGLIGVLLLITLNQLPRFLMRDVFQTWHVRDGMSQQGSDVAVWNVIKCN